MLKLSRDGWLILITKAVRSFGYGLMSVVLGLYLEAAGLPSTLVGLIMTVMLAGSALLTAVITARADRLGRRRTLMISTGMMIVSALIFGLVRNPWMLFVAALTGTISPTSGEVGPFETVESAILPQTAPPLMRNRVFGWYSTAGAVAVAMGALAAAIPDGLQHAFSLNPLTSYRWMFIVYAGAGALSLMVLTKLSTAVESVGLGVKVGVIPLRRSRVTVRKLAALFALDSLGGGFVVQSLVVYWFSLRFGADAALLGPVFFGVNVMKALSYMLAVRIADKIGLINTMVFTHLPSNVLLMLLPLMPNLPMAIVCLLTRHALSQMDVPTRASYIVAIVDPEERTAATGVTTLVRKVAHAVSPVIAGSSLQLINSSLPFFLGGGLKIIYDLALYANFRYMKPIEEREG